MTAQHDYAGDRGADVTFDTVRLGAVSVGGILAGDLISLRGVRRTWRRTNLQNEVVCISRRRIEFLFSYRDNQGYRAITPSAKEASKPSSLPNKESNKSKVKKQA